MANPLWKAGVSGNPAGRMKGSVRTVKGMVERFVKKNITPNRMQIMYDQLTSTQKLEMLMQLLPYVMPKAQADSLSQAEIDAIYQKLEKQITNVRKTG